MSGMDVAAHCASSAGKSIFSPELSCVHPPFYETTVARMIIRVEEGGWRELTKRRRILT
ncbi:hypothetical protein WUBG_04565, partial [Wuchereria bancrofti]